jgi:hypothetical protein
MSSGFLLEHTAIYDRFTSQWGATTPLRIPNRPFKQPPDGPWVALDIISSNGRPICIGQDAPTRWLGILQVTIYAPEDSGPIEALDLADQAGDIFKRKRIDCGSGYIQFRDPSLAQYAPRNNGYLCRIVDIPFYRDF